VGHFLKREVGSHPTGTHLLQLAFSFRPLWSRQDAEASRVAFLSIQFAEYGLSHWGSDTIGINTTRRFLCESLSFTFVLSTSFCLSSPSLSLLLPSLPPPRQNLRP
jgi:hypothetical protein